MERVNIEELLEGAGVKLSDISYARHSWAPGKNGTNWWHVRLVPHDPYAPIKRAFTASDEGTAAEMCDEINSLLRTLRRLKEPRRG